MSKPPDHFGSDGQPLPEKVMLLICGMRSGAADWTRDGASAARSTVRRARGPIFVVGSEVVMEFSITGPAQEVIFSRRSGICIVGSGRTGLTTISTPLYAAAPIDDGQGVQMGER